MITSKMTRAEVEAILDDDGNFLKAQIDLPMFTENFFEYGFQNNHKSFYRDEMATIVALGKRTLGRKSKAKKNVLHVGQPA